ncbi:MAG: glycosyltransferase family 4 protein [Pirellulales bacterium]|nr:glycosyltransferase family 4 protein [Pirellulales bacterium]
MTKIVHLTSVHPAGDIRILHKECRSLARAGYEVVLIAPEGRGEVVDSEVRIRYVSRRPGRIGRILGTTRRVLQAALEENAALYHLHDPELMPLVKRLGQRGAVVVFDMHENLPAAVLGKTWIPRGLRRLVAWAVRRAERWWLARVPVVFAEESYVACYPWIKRSIVVRNLPLLEELVPLQSARSPEPALAYLGVVAAQRGSLTILDALVELKRLGHEPTLECIGPAESRHQQELKTRISQLGLQNVRLHGYLPPAEAWRRIAPCHVGLAVLKRQPNLVESMPTKILEYMALGLPVVVSDFPLYRRLVDESGCGLCVNPDDPAAVAAAIARLLDDPTEAQAMGRRGRDAALAHYDWRSEASHLVEFYEQLLAPTTPQSPIPNP